MDHPLSYKLYLFDADGTLRGCTVEGRPPNTPDEVVILPNVVNTLKHYNWKREHHFGIVSNQGGIGLGYVPEELTRGMLHELSWKVTGHVWPYEVVRYCPHQPSAGCPCRKPSPGLFWQVIVWYAQMDYIFTLEDVLYVGDSPTDELAADEVPIDYMWAADFFGWV